MGWKACALLAGALAGLMMANQTNIGFGNDRSERQLFHDRDGRALPLADVPDYRLDRHLEFVDRGRPRATQHFADIDIPAIDGGPSMLEGRTTRRRSTPPSGGLLRGIRPGWSPAEEGARPFRVLELFDGMVAALVKKDVRTFVGTAALARYYVGDVSPAAALVVPASTAGCHGFDWKSGRVGNPSGTEPTPTTRSRRAPR